MQRVWSGVRCVVGRTWHVRRAMPTTGCLRSGGRWLMESEAHTLVVPARREAAEVRFLG